MKRQGSVPLSAPLALVFSLACGTTAPVETADLGGPSPDLAQGPDLAGPPLGPPIVAAAGKWTWVDVPGSSCDDGSPTGIGVNPGASGNLLLFFEGGGACCDYDTCYAHPTATKGPYQEAQFNLDPQRLVGVLNRSVADNVFKDWTYVFVPYCTGDLHAGDNVTSYSGGGQSRTYHHTGHANVAAYLQRVAATWPAPPKLAVAGVSAGGYGAALNYAFVRGFYPRAASYLVDDSGPPILGPSAPGSVGACMGNWKANLLLDPVCLGCAADPGRLPPVLSSRYPHDRLSLLSSEQDATIRAFLGLSPAEFEMKLNSYAATTLDPLANFKYYFISGQTHTMLGAPARVSVQSTTLQTWLKDLITDASSWTSLKP